MKHKGLATIFCLCLCTLGTAQSAPSQEPFNYTVFYDVARNETLPVIGYKIPMPSPFFTRYNLEVWTLFGTNMTTRQNTVGTALVYPFHIPALPKTLTFQIGLVERAEQGAPIVGGFLFGASGHF